MVPKVISAIPTAFGRDGELDLHGVSRITEHVLQGGVDSVLVNGTTGEFPSLSHEERGLTLRTVLDVAGPSRTIAHIGASSAYEAVALARSSLASGATILAALTPYYLPASRAAVRSYFTEVRRAAPTAEIFAYVFPARTGVEVSAEFAAELIRELDLAGAKVSIPGVDYVRDVAALVPGKPVYSGNDRLIVETCEAGGVGVVSGVSSAVPEVIATLARHAAAGSAEREAPQKQVNRAVSLLGPSIASLKTALHLQGVIAAPTCRMAIDPTPPQTLSAIHTLLADLYGASGVLASEEVAT